VDEEEQFFASVVAGDGSPTILSTARTQCVFNLDLWYVTNSTNLSQSIAEFCVLAIQEESFVKTGDRAEHQASSHDLLNVPRALLARALPVGIEGPERKQPFKKSLLTEDSPKRKAVCCTRDRVTALINLPGSCCNDIGFGKFAGQLVHLLGSHSRIAVEKKREVSAHCLKPLIVRCTKSYVGPISDQVNMRELVCDHISRSIA